MAEDKNKRIAIPSAVRAQLWVAAGGRCEFNCCNKKLDRHILTQAKQFMGEHAHIIADSKNGPRGDDERSKLLAHDVSNLMLLCRDCHKIIDQHEDDYSVETLREMKKKHEDHINRLYDLDGTKESLPVVLRHPIKRTHVPAFNDKEVQTAILRNSQFCQHPSEELLSLDFSKAAVREDDPAYWVEIVKQMKSKFYGGLTFIGNQRHIEHISVCAFAPMPLLMQLGVYLGNKGEVSTYQWDRTRETWLYRTERELDRQDFIFDEVPPANGRELAVALSISAEVSRAAIDAALPGTPVVNFRVPNSRPTVVEDAEDIRHFRSQFTSFLAEVRNNGYRRVHLFPAMPLSLAVELGRQILPKADPWMVVWDFQDGAKFVRTLELDYEV